MKFVNGLAVRKQDHIKKGAGQEKGSIEAVESLSEKMRNLGWRRVEKGCGSLTI